MFLDLHHTSAQVALRVVQDLRGGHHEFGRVAEQPPQGQALQPFGLAVLPSDHDQRRIEPVGVLGTRSNLQNVDVEPPLIRREFPT